MDSGEKTQVVGKGVLILHADASNEGAGPPSGLIDPKTTSILVDHATPGIWKIAAQDGSSPIVKVRHLAALPPPKVTATVRADKRGSSQQTLHWKLDAMKGQTVTFVEHANGIDHRIGSTTAKEGTLHFTAADGPPGHRDIVAHVEQDGLPRTTLTVAGFDAPQPIALTAPRVQTKSSHGNLDISWMNVNAAAAYVLDVQLSDGRRLHPTVNGNIRHLVVTSFRPGTGATILVTPLAASGRAGAAGRVAFRAIVDPPKPLPL